MNIQINHILQWWFNYASNNPLFWNWCILLVEFIEVITFIERADVYDYLTFYNNMKQEGILGDMQMSMPIQKEVLFLLTCLFILILQ